METKVFGESLKYLPYIVALDDKITEVSYAFTNLTGYDLNYLIGITTDSLCDLLRLSCNTKLDKARKNKLYHIITKSKYVREVTIVKQIGLTSSEKVFVFLEQPNSRLEDKFPAFNYFCSTDLFGFAIFSIPDRILLAANQNFYNEFCETNKDYYKILGIKIEKLLESYKCSFDSLSIFREAKIGKMVQLKECVIEHSTNGKKYFDMVVIPISEGSIVKYCYINFFDVTDRIVFKGSMNEQTNIIENHNKILQTIINEVKTPLSVTYAAIQAIECINKNEMPDKVWEFFGKIRKNSLQQLRLINNLFDITQANINCLKLNKRNIDIVAKTRTIIKSVSGFAKQKKIHVSFSAHPSSILLGIDEEKYERVILNLLSNAIKFTPYEKSIIVIISLIKDEVKIKVIDEGVGISKQEHELVFCGFERINNNADESAVGKGIGLCLVKQLVNAMGGEIKLDSELGKGSIFTISLPLIRLSDQEDCIYQEKGDKRLIKTIDMEFSDIM